MADDDEPAPDLSRLGREPFLAHQLVELEEVARRSLDMKQPGAAVAARKTAAELHMELLRLRAAKRAARQPRSHEAHEAEILRETRRARQLALIGESFVAAANLLKAEKEQLDAVRAAEELARQERLEHLEEADIVAMLAQHLLELPPEVRARVHDAVFSPVH